MLAPFPAIARMFVATKGCVEIKPAIHRYRTRAHPTGDGDCSVAILPADIAAKPKHAIICDGNGVVDVLIANDDRTGPNISSRAITASLVQENTVGLTK